MTADIDIRLLTEGDVDAALALSASCGWNQRAAEWHMMLQIAPAGTFAAVASEGIVGTAIGIDYGSFGWIAMMLVNPAYRSRGLGARLLEAAIGAIPPELPIRLDATPLGRPLYERYGFVLESSLTRYVRHASAGVPPARSGAVRPLAASDLPTVMRIDDRISGARRHAPLRWAFGDAPHYAWMGVNAGGSLPAEAGSHTNLNEIPEAGTHTNPTGIAEAGRHTNPNEIPAAGSHTNPTGIAEAGRHTNPTGIAEAGSHTNPTGIAEAGRHTNPNGVASAFRRKEGDIDTPGYCLGRGGRLFDHIGPIVAGSPDTAAALAAAAIAESGGNALVIDAHDGQERFIAWLRRTGFEPQRPLYRMCRPGDAPPQVRHADTLAEFAIMGPEFS